MMASAETLEHALTGWECFISLGFPCFPIGIAPKVTILFCDVVCYQKFILVLCQIQSLWRSGTVLKHPFARKSKNLSRCLIQGDEGSRMRSRGGMTANTFSYLKGKTNILSLPQLLCWKRKLCLYCPCHLQIQSSVVLVKRFINGRKTRSQPAPVGWLS